MRESIRAVMGFLVIVAVMLGFVAFMPDLDRSAWRWVMVGGAVVLGLAAIGVLVKMQMQKDAAPDFLFKECGSYFDRDGFCFSFGIRNREGVCEVVVYFQNRYDRRSEARVALRPARELFMRAGIEVLVADIACEPGAYGMALVEFPVPVKYQGTKQKFEVGADVRYPEGKGKTLRYRPGIFLRTGTRFGHKFGTALTVAGAAAGRLVISSPASVTMTIPSGVAETGEAGGIAEVATLWRVGDAV